MRKVFFVVALVLSAAVSAQEQEKPQVVESSCRQCNFDMKGGGCTLAVRIEGKPYFVEGTDIHKHGDAHAADGFCSVARKAEVTAEVVDNKFMATSFKLLPVKTK